MNDYKVRLEIFEGPLDLLLYLVKKAEVDIYHIPMVEITDQYLKYMELMEILDLEIAGEFIWMASHLIYIKSKMLLPPEERQAEEEEDELDPRSELIRQLIEYKRFKEAALDLEKLQDERQRYFPREAATEFDFEPMIDLKSISLFDLLNAFSEVLQKIQVRGDLEKIFEEEVSIEEKIKWIEKMVSVSHAFRFHELFIEVSSRMEVIATFLALLELIRLKKVKVMQEENFCDIMIKGTAA